MVNHGPSKACLSCKARRRKCDETRPACLRCIRAKRTCSGYDHNFATPFRYQPTAEVLQPLLTQSLARRCGLPKRTIASDVDFTSADEIPIEVSQATSDWYSFRSFLYDFCVISSGSSPSYLQTIETEAIRLPVDHPLAKACEAVAFTSHATPLNRPNLAKRAQRLYEDSVGRIAEVLQGHQDSSMVRSTVLVLGLYELMNATPLQSNCHEVHAKGLAAMMHVESTSAGLLKFMERRVKQPTGVDETTRTLLPILRIITQIWDIFRHCESRSITMVAAKCVELESELLVWHSLLRPELLPAMVGRVKYEGATKDVPLVAYHTGQVDTYMDLPTAAILNLYRTATLLLYAVRVKSSDGSGELPAALPELVQRAIAEIISSIPYHLTHSVHGFVISCEESRSTTLDRGRTLGGMLLMHPLYIVSGLPFIDFDVRAYFQQCLKWIGDEMGIGYARLLAECDDYDSIAFDSSMILVWAGFLL